VEACLAADAGRLVHVSSIAAVGISRDPSLMDESTEWNAGGLGAAYFDSKHMAEERVREGVAAGLDAVIVNPGAIYGPSAASSNSSRLVASAARGRIRVVPSGGINAVPLATVVEGTLAAAERGRTGRRYILGGENITYMQLIQRIGRAAGRSVNPIALPTLLGPAIRAAMNMVEPFVPDRLSFTPDLAGAFGRWMWFDTRRMVAELGIGPASDASAECPASLDECLAATVEQLRRDGRLPPA
jgi:dihydroflavonol-4-reductase